MGRYSIREALKRKPVVLPDYTVGKITATSICYPFPLRPGFLAQLVLPRDLTDNEAMRLCELIMSLATPSPQASGE